MRERRGRTAEVYPSPSQLQQQSRSAHLLSIRLEQYGLPFHAAAYVHLQLKKCCCFLELEVDHVIGFGKALCSWLHPTIRRAFARCTECALGNRRKQRISLKSSQ